MSKYNMICKLLTEAVNNKNITKEFAKEVNDLAHRKYISESVLVSHKDIEYKVNEWKNGSTNILFITGLSGSGKSTLASQLEKEYNAINFELDLFEHNRILFSDYKGKMSEADQIMKDLITKKYGGKKIFKFETDKDSEYFGEQLSIFIHDLIQIARKDKDRKYIFEGIQITRLGGRIYDEMKNYPIIIKGTSALQSLLRRVKRDKDSGDSLLNHPWELIKYYINSEKRLKEFKKKIKNN